MYARVTLVILFSSVASLMARPSHEGLRDDDQTVAGQFRHWREEFDSLVRASEHSDAAPKNAETTGQVQSRLTARRHALGDRFLKLAENHAQDPAAVDALLWVMENDAESLAAEKAVDLLLRHHATDPRVSPSARGAVHRMPYPAAERLLRGLAKSLDSPDVKSRMRASLAAYLGKKSDWARSLKSERDQGKLRLHLDPVSVSDLRASDPELLAHEAESLLEQVIQAAGPDAKNARLMGFAKGVLAEIRTFGVGKQAPDIDGEDFDGRPMRLRAWRGKVVVLKFWGTWCGPCMGMVPHDRELFQRLQGRPFALLGIDSDEDRAHVKRVTQDQGMSWPSWWDGGSRDGPIAKRWNVSTVWGWPTIYVLDAQHTIRYKGLRGQALDDAVDYLLAETSRTESRDGRR